MTKNENSTSRFVQWAEVIGLICLVLSLIFVGVQIRQNNSIAKAEAYQSFVSSMNDLYIAMAQPHVGEALNRVYMQGVPFEDLSSIEKGYFISIFTSIIRIHEGIFKQVQAGVLDESAYSLVSGYFRDSGQMKTTWMTQRGNISDDFRIFIESEYPFLRPKTK